MSASYLNENLLPVFYQGKGVKFEQALAKINEAFDSIAEFKKEVSDLEPKQRSANSEIKDLKEIIEGHKQEYRVVSLLVFPIMLLL